MERETVDQAVSFSPFYKSVIWRPNREVLPSFTRIQPRKWKCVKAEKWEVWIGMKVIETKCQRSSEVRVVSLTTRLLRWTARRITPPTCPRLLTPAGEGTAPPVCLSVSMETWLFCHFWSILLSLLCFHCSEIFLKLRHTSDGSKVQSDTKLKTRIYKLRTEEWKMMTKTFQWWLQVLQSSIKEIILNVWSSVSCFKM